ncbi:MAG: SpoIIE family protein phosphatase [Planctomycetaceae bacterium]|nr:SpoIIE family protein phosphatase [Planctomycetaceae bacterium]
MSQKLTDSSDSQDDSESEISFGKSHWSIGKQLLLAVNGVCIGLVLVFHVYDYQKELKRRLDDKRIALHDEAVTTQEAVRELQHHGRDALQKYIDRVCARMEEGRSPGHHIAVRIGDDVLQARAHERQSHAMLEALEQAAGTSNRLGHVMDRDFVVGTSQDFDLSVYVSEYVDSVQHQAARDSLRRFGGSATLGLLAAVIVNFVLLRIVVRPLERLVSVVEQIGEGHFGKQANGFRSLELSYLSAAINRMSQSLADSDRNRRTQMAKARRIQQNLLPRSTALTGATFAVFHKPAEDVAGDFYDVHTLPDGSWLAFMADVTGHGIPAAMTATLLKAYFAEAWRLHTDPLEIIRHVNGQFTELSLAEDFATAILVRYSPNSRILQVVNAGHDASLYRSKYGQIQECSSSGLLLGIDSSADWSITELETAPGDRLLMFTDGVTETFNADHTMFGRDRILGLLNETAGEVPTDALESIRREIAAFRGDGPQLDDVTVLLFEF